MTAKNCRIRSFLVFISLFAVTFAAAQSASDDDALGQSTSSNSVTSTTIPASLFGMTAHSGVLYSTPWPTMPVYGIRLWDTNTGWAQINTSKGDYDWSTLNNWIDAASAHNAEVIYTFGMTPSWASSKPSDSACDYSAGACDAPSDLNSDGTGSDQHFIDFVTAIAKHAPSIKYWELWNTPHDPKQWTGTDAQLVRMAKDANTYIKKYIPDAKIIAPANGQLKYKYPNANCTMAEKMGDYLAAGLGNYVDVMAFHTYYTDVPEDIVPVIQCYQSTMKTYGIASLPLWSTEGSWGFNTGFSSTTDQAGFVARLYLLLWSNGVARHYWYAWDDDRTGTLSDNGILNTVGTAYQQVESWMSARTMSTLCSESKSGIWTCGFTGDNGYSSLAVWHPGGNTSYTAASKYVDYLDLGGKQHNISSGATVTVGEEPILLEVPSATQKPPDFSLSQSTPFPEVTVASTATSGSLTISAKNGFSSKITLSCSSTTGTGGCSVSPTSVSKFPATVTLSVNGSNFAPGTYQVSVQGVSGSLNHSFNVPFSVGDFSLNGPTAFPAVQSGQVSAGLTLASQYSYSGQINATCDASALAGAQCTLSPANPISVSSGGSVPLSVALTIPSNAAGGTYNITVDTQDVTGGPVHLLALPVTAPADVVQDFSFGSFSPPTQTINAGQAATYSFTLAPSAGSFPNAISLTCTGAPTLSRCAFTPNPATPGATASSIVMTITTTANSSAASHRTAALLYLPWAMLPAIILIGVRTKPSRSSKGPLLISVLCLLLFALMLTACTGATGIANSSTGGGGTTIQHQQGTQSGTYNITVTGTSGSITHQATAITLIVN